MPSALPAVPVSKLTLPAAGRDSCVSKVEAPPLVEEFVQAKYPPVACCKPPLPTMRLILLLLSNPRKSPLPSLFSRITATDLPLVPLTKILSFPPGATILNVLSGVVVPIPTLPALGTTKALLPTVSPPAKVEVAPCTTRKPVVVAPPLIVNPAF